MQSPFDNIVQHLFHQPSLQSVTVDELERMAQQHPYFAAAHFLLLKKMQVTDHPQFDTQLHKTTLYFNNPLWLQFLLQPETVSNFKVSEKAPFITDEPVVAEENKIEEPVLAAENTYEPALQQPLYEEPAQYQDKETANETHGEHIYAAAPETHAGIMDVITAIFNEPAEENQQPPHQPTVAEEIKTDAWQENPPATFSELPVETHTIAEPLAEENTIVAAGDNETFTEPLAAFEDDPATLPAENNTASFNDDVTETVIESLEENNAATYHEPGLVANADIETAPVTVNEIPQAIEPGITITPEEIILKDVQENVPEPAVLNEADDTAAPVTAEEPASDEKPLFRTIIETPAAKDDLLFEPYHTVDYFASQGIKLSKQETDSKDKLGRQLKSFTEWLKSMKKLPQVSIDKMLAQNEESKVVEDAIHSIENKEVITEAMAEVFEKQGLTEKAAEVYQKLSLLNPAKSAYFAAKIDLLKN